MGKGAFVTVTNNTDKTIRSFIENQQCMYSNGDDGSHLERLNNLTLQSDQSSPTIYVEDKGSGACAFESSYYTLKFVYPNDDNRVIGHFKIVDNEDVEDNTASGTLNVNINTSGDQNRIDITVG